MSSLRFTCVDGGTQSQISALPEPESEELPADGVCDINLTFVKVFTLARRKLLLSMFKECATRELVDEAGSLRLNCVLL